MTRKKLSKEVEEFNRLYPAKEPLPRHVIPESLRPMLDSMRAIVIGPELPTIEVKGQLVRVDGGKWLEVSSQQAKYVAALVRAKGGIVTRKNFHAMPGMSGANIARLWRGLPDELKQHIDRG